MFRMHRSHDGARAGYRERAAPTQPAGMDEEYADQRGLKQCDLRRVRVGPGEASVVTRPRRPARSAWQAGKEAYDVPGTPHPRFDACDMTC